MAIGDDVPVVALRNQVEAGFRTALADLVKLVEIPGIAWPAFDPRHLDHSAEAVAELLRDAGVGDVRIVRGAGQGGKPGGPAVLARKPAAEGRATVLLYAHHSASRRSRAVAHPGVHCRRTRRTALGAGGGRR